MGFHMANTTGLSTVDAGTILTYQDNHRTGNIGDGAATAPLSVN